MPLSVSVGKLPDHGHSTTARVPSSDRGDADDVAHRPAPGQDEQSPLLSPTSDSAGGDDDSIDGRAALYEPGRGGSGSGSGSAPASADPADSFQTTKSVWYLVLLTVSIGGLQIAWSVELSNGSPYLLSLGLSKSLMALVWIAGPLSGTLVQPYIGMLSDNCRIPWGKRKPFMLGGALATIFSLMVLAWAKEIVGAILGLFGLAADSQGVKVATIVVAVLWVYILDFAINTVQAAIRAFILDCAPAHQQEAANAMASRIIGIGNILGYVAGFVNLPSMVWWLGRTQFQDLCAIASIALASTVLVSCVFVRERDPRLDGPPPRNQPGLLAFFAKIFTSIRRLPPQTKKVCTVQFFAWIGFFPMLFYTSSYIGEIYVEPFLEENPHMTPAELDELYERATRVGTFALLIYSITSLVTNLFLPFFIAPTYDAPAGAKLDDGPASTSWLESLVIPGFTLRRAWMFSHVLFAASMFCTVFVRTVAAATVLIGLVGITWALTLWAPWAIISSEISRRDALLRAQRHRLLATSSEPPSSGSQDSLRDRSPPARSPGPGSSDGGSDSGSDSGSDGGSDTADAKDEDDDAAADQAGVILGIHNMAIAAPQIIATVASSIIFRVFQKPRGVPGDRSIAIVLALGGMTVLIAAWFVHKIEDEAPMAADDLSALEEGDGVAASGPRSPHIRRQSYESLPRASLERAALVRHSSFGGAEY